MCARRDIENGFQWAAFLSLHRQQGDTHYGGLLEGENADQEGGKQGQPNQADGRKQEIGYVLVCQSRLPG